MSKSIARILVAGMLLAPVTALAVPITVEFTVTSTGVYNQDATITPGGTYAGFGPGVVGGGHFTFDDAIGNALDLQAGLPTLDLEFNWLGHTFTEATASIYQLGFNSTGGLSIWGFGPTAPTREGCGLNCFSHPGPTDFWVTSNNSYFHIEGFNAAMVGSIEWTARPANVPEPATLGLLGLGLLGAAFSRRRRALA